jgi:hypothetical protein
MATCLWTLAAAEDGECRPSHTEVFTRKMLLFVFPFCSDNRILVAADNLPWFYAAPELCKQAALFSAAEDDARPPVLTTGTSAHHGRLRNESHEQPTSTPKRYLDCFFLPTTKYSLPADWNTHAKKMTAMNGTDQIVHLRAFPRVPFTNDYQRLRPASEHPVLAQHKDKPVRWWKAQLAKFVLRPTNYTLRQLVWPLQHAAFYETQGALPHPLAAIFIRAGDKHKEATPMSVDAHFAELAPVAAQMGIKDVYLGSDSHDRIAEAITKYGTTYNIHFFTCTG